MSEELFIKYSSNEIVSKELRWTQNYKINYDIKVIHR